LAAILVRMTSKQDLLLDAADLSKAAATLERPSARTRLEALVQSIQKEAEASSEGVAPADPVVTPVPAPPKPIPQALAAAAAPASAPTKTYTNINRFSFDFGGSSSAFVTLYIPVPGVTPSTETVDVQFTDTSFDLRVTTDKDYRLLKTHLEKKIDPSKCKVIKKTGEIRIKLAKIKGEYGSYDYWSNLTDEKALEKKAKSSDNPQDSIMSLMKDMYDNGDDKMKKMIGETMLKQRNGQLEDPKMPGMDMDDDDE